MDRRSNSTFGLRQRTKRLRSFILISSVFILIGCIGPSPEIEQADHSVRIALFNIWEMSTVKLTNVDALGKGQEEQLLAAAQIVKEIDPDVLIINEIDHDLEALLAGEDLALNPQRFQNAYLDSVIYDYIYIPPAIRGFWQEKILTIMI